MPSACGLVRLSTAAIFFNMNEIQNTVCDFAALHRAMRICSRNVRWKDSVVAWNQNALENCLKLRESLYNGSYRISPYSTFIVYEPKRRDIVSTRFKDRVFQRSLCDNYLTAALTKSFIHDNAACQQGKGTMFARKRLKCHLQRHWRKYGLNGWVLKLDIKSFFASTPHSAVKAAAKKRVTDPWAYGEVCRIIDSFNQGADPGVGMGLGSQVTQLTQLAVLDDIDHFIKERLHIRGYVRYMDDLVLIHPDKAHLKRCLEAIAAKLSALGLRLNAKKTMLAPIRQAIRFLGFSFRLTGTGKVVQRILPQKVSHERRKLRRMAGLYRAGRMTKNHIYECFKSWVAHALQGDNYHVIRRMKQFYQTLWEGDNYVCV